MGAKRYEELEAWQLCRQLADEVAALLTTRKASADFDLFNQLKSASRAPCRNIAEGFGRYYPKEFAPFLRIAKGSLLETGEHLRDARGAGWTTTDREAELIRLRDRAVAATPRNRVGKGTTRGGTFLGSSVPRFRGSVPSSKFLVPEPGTRG
jgi:four helix bundle protein